MLISRETRSPDCCLALVAHELLFEAMIATKTNALQLFLEVQQVQITENITLMACHPLTQPSSLQQSHLAMTTVIQYWHRYSIALN